MATRLAASRWNDLEDRIVKRCSDMVDFMVKELLVERGVPPFMEATPEREMYYTLAAMKAANAPEFTNDPEAQKVLTRLEGIYGTPPGTPSQTPTGPAAQSLSILGRL